MVVEIMRLIVPAKKIINDNAGQHYKIHMGKLQWLTNQACLAIEGYEILGFKCPSPEYINNLTNNGKNFKLIFEHWKCQQTFDLTNYEMMFKPLVDVFTKNKYWEDDCWKYAWPILFNGGDYSVWKDRAIRLPGDNLPESIKKDWWISNGMEAKGDSFIRILIDTDQKI